MIITFSLKQRLCRLLVCIAMSFLFNTAVHAEEPAKPDKPEIDDRPVFFMPGKVFVFPKGVDEPPKDYRGSIGPRPLALVTIDDKVVGEIYASPLEGTPAEEAKGMAASADDNENITLEAKTRIKEDGKDVEVVTLKLDVKSNVGRPWILHSLYFPRGDASLTFKLATSQEKFETVLPYFETMLSFGEDRTKKGSSE